MPVSITPTQLPEPARSGPQTEEDSISSAVLPNNEVSSTSTDQARLPCIPPAPPSLPEKRSTRTMWLYFRRGELIWYFFDNHSNHQPEYIIPPESARNRAEVARDSTAERERERLEREERESLSSVEKRTKRESVNDWVVRRSRGGSSSTYKSATREPIPEETVNPIRVSEQSSDSPNSLPSSTTSRCGRLVFLPRRRPGRTSFSKPFRNRNLYTSFDMAIRKGQQEGKGVQKVADEVSKSQPGSRRGSADLSSSAKKSNKENARPEQKTKAEMDQADQKLLNAAVAEALNVKKPRKTEAKGIPPKAKQHTAKQQKKEKKVGSGNELDGSSSGGAGDIELVKFPTAIHAPSAEQHTGTQEKSDANARPASSYGIQGEGRFGVNAISRSSSVRPAVTENQGNGKGKGKVEKSCSMADLMSSGKPRSGTLVSNRKPLPSGSADYGSNGKGSGGLSRSNAKKQP
ncbi:MAG: hypothetical protein Q9214_004868, partial [Letrouitia sp. 1 TL-2023]